MVAKTTKPVILPTKSWNPTKQAENNLFIGEWTQADTNKMCNPRPKKNAVLEQKRIERLEKYHAKKNKS